MTVFVISPHLDDAVLSLGQFLQTVPATVVTVFAGNPNGDVLSDYDAAHGYASSAQAMHERRAEDAEAVALLGATHEHLPLTDRQYGTQPDEHVIDVLRDFIEPDTYVPLGIGHPDHVQVARCVRRMARFGMPLFFYEELPYRVDHPEQAHDALGALRADGFAIQDLPYPLPQGDRYQKAAAIASYASQFPDGADNPALLVAERVWRAVKNS